MLQIGKSVKTESRPVVAYGWGVGEMSGTANRYISFREDEIFHN